MNLLTVLAGPGDFLSDPDWGSVAFLESPAQFLLGIILALVVLAALIRIGLLIFGLVGADRHKARNIGEGVLLTLVAIFAALNFQSIFGSMLSGMA